MSKSDLFLCPIFDESMKYMNQSQTEIHFETPEISCVQAADGSFKMSNTSPIKDCPSHILEPFAEHSVLLGDRVWLGEKTVDGWWTINYRDGFARVKAVAQWLLQQGYGQDDCLFILSGNSIRHGVLTYGSIGAGVPVVPVSPSYSLFKGRETLQAMVDLMRPTLVYVEDGSQYEAILNEVEWGSAGIVYGKNEPDLIAEKFCLDQLWSTPSTGQVDKAFSKLHYDMVAKYLFTSGSTGKPKAVANTHRMMCCNPIQADAIFREGDPVHHVLVDWLPWSHTYGGNANLNGVTSGGSSLYIDPGMPVSDLFHHTIDSLRSISPTIYNNVPSGYDMLVSSLESCSTLAAKFFEKLHFLSTGGAKLSQKTHDRMQDLYRKYRGDGYLPFLSGYGSTETAPVATRVFGPSNIAGLIGLPVPGVDLKLLPTGDDLYEIRVKGPMVTPGYFVDQQKISSDNIFDTDGYYLMKDLVSFLEKSDPAKGLKYEGRLAETFKLATGTWISAGKLRNDLVSCTAPYTLDLLVTGLNQPYLGLLIWLSDSGHKLKRNDLINEYRNKIEAHNMQNPRSSRAIKRIFFLDGTPDRSRGEINDKGYVNQAVALRNRASLVANLYSESSSNQVIII